MRRKNLLKELGIQKQADTSCNALDIDAENVRQRVYAKLDFADTERKQTTMRSKKKILPLLIAATLTIGVTAVAATGKISMWTGSSASRADYTSLPTSEQITKDVGYRPVLIDTFENGYCFKEGNIIKNSFKDGNANVIENFKSVSFDYQKNGDVVSFERQPLVRRVFGKVAGTLTIGLGWRTGLAEIFNEVFALRQLLFFQSQHSAGSLQG